MIATRRKMKKLKGVVVRQKPVEQTTVNPTLILSVEKQVTVQPQTENVVPGIPPEGGAIRPSQSEEGTPLAEVSPTEVSQVVDTIFPSKTEQVNLAENPPSQNPIVRIFLLFAVFIAGAIIGSLTMYFVVIEPSGKDLSENKPVPTVTATQVLTPTKEPVDLGKYSIKILNGSKIKGEAAKLKTNLETDGFKVLSAGNATSSAFAETTIRVKKNIEESYLEKLKGFLAKAYVLAKIQELDSSEKTDVVIIIGSKLSP